MSGRLKAKTRSNEAVSGEQRTISSYFITGGDVPTQQRNTALDAIASEERTDPIDQIHSELVSEQGPSSKQPRLAIIDDEPCRPTLPSTKSTGLPDISDIVNSVCDEVKSDITKRIPLVEPGFCFPTTLVKEKKNSTGVTKRKCSLAIFQRYPFLAYSKKTDGVFCVPCKLWYTTPSHGTEASYLVSEPYRDWKKIHDKMKVHTSTIYHKDATQKMAYFLQVQQKNPMQRSALEAQSSAHAKLVSRNREVIGAIFTCLKLCIERGFARRGHRDWGEIAIDGEKSIGVTTEDIDQVINLGNFKAIVKFCAESANLVLKDHLLTAAKNATYVSAVAQDDMSRTFLKSIQQSIVQEARNQNGKFIFAVSADEVTDVSTTEQLGIVIRTISPQGKVRERLLEFIEMDSITGEDISHAIVDCLQRHGLSIQDCRAQTYDGAGNMSGIHEGCQARILQLQPLAEYHHCSSHRLNLALNAISKVSEYRIMIENLKALGIFFKYSPKRQNVLKKCLPKDCNLTKVKLLCETRWVERHTTMTKIKTLYLYIQTALSMMTGATYDTKTIVEAAGLLRCMQSPQFIAAFLISEHMLGYTKQLSQQLQGSTKTILAAHKNISDVIKVVKATRGNDEVFDSLWKLAKELNEDCELEVPRLTGKQTNRSNPATDSPKSYYKVAYFYPYVDHLGEELERRFCSRTTVVDGFHLIPAVLTDVSYSKFKDVVMPFASKHNDDLPDTSALKQELHTYYTRWQDSSSANEIDDLPKAYQVALQSGLFPNVSYLLKVLLVIPVTSASVERANSTLKFIKNPLRSTMSQMSLNAMVLGYKHKDLMEKIIIADLVTDFALTKKRRLHLLNPLAD